MSGRRTRQHFLNRKKTKELFRGIFARDNGKGVVGNSRPFRGFPRRQPDLPLHALGQPDAQHFGWQRPCYLLGEGYAKTFAELMDSTEWDQYGVGNYEKCADCMVHSGFEATAVIDSIKHPLKAVGRDRGPEDRGRHGPGDRPLETSGRRISSSRRHVEQAMAEMAHEPKRGARHGGSGKTPSVAAE